MVDVDDSIKPHLCGLTGQVGWLGLRVCGHGAPPCIHQMNRMNSRNGLAMMTEP